jgi:UDP-2-acetamido-3-amino-2,3-dideoxy-glucuronate N-acetyltransferase
MSIHPQATIHSTAIVDPGATIGTGTSVWHWTHICAGARIGSNCSFGQGVYVGNRVVIGDKVKVQNNVSIFDAVTLEDEVFCGPSMVFTNVVNPRSHIIRKHEYRPTLVRRGATIGANATIVCGHTIGRYAMIGAGAVTSRDVLDHALMLGVPAKHSGWVCRCGCTLPIGEQVTCASCQDRYTIQSGNCVPVA